MILIDLEMIFILLVDISIINSSSLILIILNILVNSMPELLTYKYIKTAFPDAIHNYRPDWLKNSNTKRNLEIE